MHVKLGDTVKVISGRDKGKIGEVSKIFKHNSSIVVKEINMKTKHMKSREEGEPGQILKVVSYVAMFLNSSKASNFGIKHLEISISYLFGHLLLSVKLAQR